jgi:hypothetical protein
VQVLPRKTISLEIFTFLPLEQIEHVSGGSRLQQNFSAAKNKLFSISSHPSAVSDVVSNTYLAHISPNNGSALFKSGISDPSERFKVNALIFKPRSRFSSFGIIATPPLRK